MMMNAHTSRNVAVIAFSLLGTTLAGCASNSNSHVVGGRSAATSSARDASTTAGRSFDSPEQAVAALVAAIRQGSPDKIKSVLGPEAEDLVRSGDPVQDDNRRAHFLAMYDQRHRIDTDQNENGGNGDVTLCSGESDWPFPIPLTKDEKTGGWHFDTSRGKDEVLNRRVGHNELSAIQVCLAIVDAERDYAARGAAQMSSTSASSSKSSASNATTQPTEPEYASRFISDTGKTNGLYWNAKPGESQSPLGPLVAAAADEGYQFSRHAPYHGYYYRILTAQGPHADGGAYEYKVNGRMIGGFAVLARPASYGNSGVMTFVVNHDGVVYQSDLGPDTEKAVRTINAFDPGDGWAKAQ